MFINPQQESRNTTGSTRLKLRRRLSGLAVSAATGLAILSGWAPQASAALNTGPGGWVMGMASSGSLPFDALDTSGGDTIVRTHDHVVYRVGFTTIGGVDTNSLITLSTTGFTTPPTYTGTPLARASYFSLLG